MIECINFRSLNRGTLQGFADIFVPKWGVEIHGFTLHMKDGKRWINFPSKEYKNEKGETKYSSTIRFKKKDHYEVFCNEVKKAIDTWCNKNA